MILKETHWAAGAMAEGGSATNPELLTAAASKRAIAALVPAGIPARAGFPMLSTVSPMQSVMLDSREEHSIFFLFESG